MLGKIKSDSSDDWHDVSRTDSQKPQKAPPGDDRYRKIEGEKERRPSKDDQEKKGVEVEKKPRSVYDLPKQDKPKSKTASDSGLKGKLGVKKEKTGMEEESELEGAIGRPLPKKEEDQEADFFSDDAGAEMEVEILEPPVEADASPDELPQTEEAQPPPSDKALPETPKPLPGPGKETPHAIKQTVTLTPEQLAATQLKSKKSEKPVAFETEGERFVSKKDKSKGEARTTTETGGEKGVAATAQPSIQAAAFHSEKVQAASESSRSATIRELAEQIIDRIQIMRKDDLTSTIITLRHPPVLAGSTITLTASDNAKREFNISFANLSPDAKSFLDRKLSEDSLSETLERKGIIVHNITTTTEPEKVISADAGQASKDRQEQQQEQQQQKRQSSQEPEEEEVT